MDPVVVFGGTGFIGQAICRRLAAGGRRPVAVGRRGFSLAAIDGAAGLVNAIPDLAASLAVLRGAAWRGVPLVHLSSMAVYGGIEGLVAEGAAIDPRTAYARAKAAAERAALEAGATVLRPGLVYGAGGEAWTGRMARLLRARRLGDLGAAGDGFCNLVHVDEVAGAVVAALRRPAPGEAFNLGLAAPPRWNDYLVRFARLLGATPVARLGGRRLALEALEAVPRRLLRRGDAITPSLVRLFGQQIVLDTRKVGQWLDFERLTLEAGLAAAAAWCRA